MVELEKIKWFHTMDLNGYITKGLCDWRPYKKNFFLEKTINKTVLDVGAGDGYFSFEMEKIGAHVTATEIDSQLNRDNYNFGLENIKSKHSLIDGYSFKAASLKINSSIKLISSNIYDIDKDVSEKFDVVFCSDVIMHLTDPIKALQNIHKISKKYLILGNPINHMPIRGQGKKKGIKNIFKNILLKLLNEDPYILFQGHTSRNIFWLPTTKGIEAMLNSCGFRILKKNIFFSKKEHHVSPQKRIVILAEKF
jgi:SAM-dependent methyltransferase